MSDLHLGNLKRFAFYKNKDNPNFIARIQHFERRNLIETLYKTDAPDITTTTIICLEYALVDDNSNCDIFYCLKNVMIEYKFMTFCSDFETLDVNKENIIIKNKYDVLAEMFSC